MESNKSNQEDRSQQQEQPQPSKQEGLMTRASEASMQELADACEKTFKEKGYDRRQEESDRRKEGFDRRQKDSTGYEGVERRKVGSDRRQEGGNRRREVSDRRQEEGDRRQEGFDRRQTAPTDYEGLDRRKEGSDRREEEVDRRQRILTDDERFDRREEVPAGARLKGRAFKIKAGLTVVLIAIVSFFTIPIPGLSIINDNEYVVTRVEGRAHMKYQAEYSGDREKSKDLTIQVEGEWKPLTEGTVIAAGSRVIIETGSNSTVDLLTDEGMIVRIAKDSTVRLEEKRGKEGRLQGFVSKGKFYVNIVSANLKRFKSAATLKMEVSTPNATCGVRGTIFSVDFLPDSYLTNISVLTGALSVADPGTAASSDPQKWNDLRQGQTIRLSNPEGAITRRDLDASEIKMFSEAAPTLDTAHTFFESMRRAWRGLWWWLSLADAARQTRTENEMGAIMTTLHQKGMISSGALPAALSDKSIPTGDMKDPWGNSYIYIRYRPDLAVVISAGPDGIYNTPDDLYRFLSI